MKTEIRLRTSTGSSYEDWMRKTSDVLGIPYKHWSKRGPNKRVLALMRLDPQEDELKQCLQDPPQDDPRSPDLQTSP